MTKAELLDLDSLLASFQRHCDSISEDNQHWKAALELREIIEVQLKQRKFRR